MPSVSTVKPETSLSVNINKIATLRNARGENNPDLLQKALECEHFGADGITVHPRPDERHVRRADVYTLATHISKELNIEGYPSPDFIELIKQSKPAQVTLVPDRPEAITSTGGWDVKANIDFLTDVVGTLKATGARVSIFVEPDSEQVKAAATVGAQRVEFYTKPYAEIYPLNPAKAVEPYRVAALAAIDAGLGVNAGHDLSLQNLAYFHSSMPRLDEVSIGHALICDALDMGLRLTIARYLECLNRKP